MRTISIINSNSSFTHFVEEIYMYIFFCSIQYKRNILNITFNNKISYFYPYTNYCISATSRILNYKKKKIRKTSCKSLSVLNDIFANTKYIIINIIIKKKSNYTFVLVALLSIHTYIYISDDITCV